MKNNVENLNYFINVIEQNVCPENMNVDLDPHSTHLSFFHHNKNHGRLKDKHVDQLCNALISGRCATSPNIDLSWNSLTDKNIKKIANVLQHPNRPEKISLHLRGNVISDKAAIEILDAIQNGQASDININLSGECKVNGFGMHFLGNKITDKTAFHLAYLFKHKNFPQNVSLDFSRTKISTDGVLAIVKALEESIKQGHYPKGLALNFDKNGIVKELLTRLDNILDHQIIAGNIKHNKPVGIANNPASFHQSIESKPVLKEIEKVESTNSFTF